MRKLIVQRKKTAMGAAIKARVFIQHSQGELELGGIKCKEIGSLKSGDIEEYDIPDMSVYVFVVSGKVLPDMHHSYYQIPDGDGNVELFITPRFGLVKGTFDICVK